MGGVSDDALGEDDYLRWSAIARGAYHLFNVWVDCPELAWAQKAWEYLEAADQTRYGNDRERTRLLIRLLALAAFYHSWCRAAWQEGEIDLSFWAGELGVSQASIARLSGDRAHQDHEGDAETPYDAVLTVLVEEEYDALVEILTKAFGGASGLFIALWLSREPEWSGRTELPDELKWGIVNEDLTADKGSGFSWIDNGCPMGGG